MCVCVCAKLVNGRPAKQQLTKCLPRGHCEFRYLSLWLVSTTRWRETSVARKRWEPSVSLNLCGNIGLSELEVVTGVHSESGAHGHVGVDAACERLTAVWLTIKDIESTKSSSWWKIYFGLISI